VIETGLERREEEVSRLMSGTNHPDRSLEELKARIREQAAGMRERAAAAVSLTARSPAAWVFNWLEFKSRLKIGAALAQLDVMPLLPRFHGIKRRVALAASQAVLYLTRFITRRQSDLNAYLLDSLREMGEALHTVETRVVQQQEQIRQLEACVSQLQLRLSSTAPGRRPERERKAS
jgi:hypothetical protein